MRTKSPRYFLLKEETTGCVFLRSVFFRILQKYFIKKPVVPEFCCRVIREIFLWERSRDKEVPVLCVHWRESRVCQFPVTGKKAEDFFWGQPKRVLICFFNNDEPVMRILL